MSYEDLDHERVKSYLLTQTSLFEDGADLSVYEYGRNERDGDGYVNYLYRVRDERTGESAVVKQAKPYMKVFGNGRVPLAVERNATEVDIIRLRSAIVPQYVTELYHADAENNLYVCEDCGRLAVMRYELCRGRSFPLFPRQIAEYMAKCNFYTSELYLDPKAHKLLACRFVNPDMRHIMETILFSGETFVSDEVLADREPDPFHEAVSGFFWERRELRVELLKLRDIYMKQPECLQHGDLHTSNIMIGEDEMKVFDMEYTYMGPYSADSGYLAGNLLYAYISWFFREVGTERERAAYRGEVLGYLRDMMNEYMKIFTDCWNRDARDPFRSVPEYQRHVMQNYVRETCGFTGSQMISRVGSLAELPDFDAIEDRSDRNMARTIAMTIGYRLVMERDGVRSVDDIVAIARETADKFVAGASF